MESFASRVWVAIPARGGSVGIPRKNVYSVAGHPLISYTIRTALAVLPAERVVVITDDDEIAEVAEFYGSRVIRETVKTPSQETLDVKILRNLDNFERFGANDGDYILTMQPTSPLLKSERIAEAVDLLDSGRASVLTVSPDQHLRWGLSAAGEPEPHFTTRVNRQQLPMEYRESGGIIGARLGDIRAQGTRVISPVGLIPLDDAESIDIDAYADLFAAEHLLTRMKVVIRCDAAASLGLGHVYRALAMSYVLGRHELVLVTSSDKPLGAEVISHTPFTNVEVSSDADFVRLVGEVQPDLVIMDILDTHASQISSIRVASPKTRIVTFEDSGSGAHEADLLVSEFLTVPGVSKQIGGIENAILSPSFETLPRVSEFSERVGTVLVLFGGTDPSHLAVRALDALQAADFTGRVVVARGLGAEPIDASNYTLDLTIHTHVANMARLMSEADLAFTSAGRTVIELAATGVPSICLAQNDKEMTHNHATASNGVMMLGLGRETADETIVEALKTMLTDSTRRREFRQAALNATATRSNMRVMNHVLDLAGLHHAIQ